jgi:hypothetical protein
MKSSFAAAVVLFGFSLSAFAQQSAQYGSAPHKVKPSTSQKPAKSTALPTGKSAGAGTSSAANAKDLQAIEHQSAKTSGHRAAGKKGPGAGAAIKPVKEKPNAPINFGGSGGKGGLSNGASNPLRGRLKQKGAHQSH